MEGFSQSSSLHRRGAFARYRTIRQFNANVQYGGVTGRSLFRAWWRMVVFSKTDCGNVEQKNAPALDFALDRM